MLVQAKAKCLYKECGFNRKKYLELSIKVLVKGNKDSEKQQINLKAKQINLHVESRFFQTNICLNSSI